MFTASEKVNSRVEEFEFIISIFNDLAHKYQGHNTRLLEELISQMEYRRETEETTVVAKARSDINKKQSHYKK
jgi:hypothetical protein